MIRRAGTRPPHIKAVSNNALFDFGQDESPNLIADGQGGYVAVWASDEPIAGQNPGIDFDIFTARTIDNGLS